MSDRGQWRRRGLGSALLFFWLFLTLGLVGYDPQDPPSAAVWTAEPRPTQNPCGPVGAWLAHGLFQGFGWSSVLVLWALGVVTLLILRNRTVPATRWHVAGFGLILATAACLLGTLELRLGAPLLSRSPTVGTGGYLGSFGASFLTGQFGSIGSLLILSALGVAGLALGHEALVLWPLYEVRAALDRRPERRAVAGRELAVPAGLSVLGPPVEPAPGGALGTSFQPRAVLPAPLPPGRPRGEVPANRGAAPTVAYQRPPGNGGYEPPPLEFLEPPVAFPVQEHESLIQQRAMVLERTLSEHGCNVRVVQIDTGPVITMFEIELEAGLRVSRIVGLANDLAIALAVPSVRIVSPIPGKTTVGLEVPNERRQMVRLLEVLQGSQSELDRMRIPLFLGKDVKGEPLLFDLQDMPHLLIAGRTGTGKSVCLNAMILSILMTRRPDEVKLLLIDPKMVELSQFKRIPHLMHPVITDMKKAESVLSWACEKMDERYALLARAGVRNLQAYNALGPDEILARLQPESDEERERIPTYMPYIVIVADEMADLMMTAAKEVESHIVRLAQKARAVGMHLIVATQKPTVDVITGLIKGNLPARIAFQVASRGDSRVVLDEMGADKLLGNGDMLFLKPGTSHIIRAQGTYVSDLEVSRISHYLERYPVEFSKELVQLKVAGGKDGAAALKERDDMYEAAIEVIIREGRGSCSLLQRALGIGYGRAARLIDFMAEDGIVGEYKSGTFREVNYTWEEWETLKNGGEPAGSAA